MRLLMELGASETIINICLILSILVIAIIMYIRYKEIGTDKSIDRDTDIFIAKRPWIIVTIYIITILFVLLFDQEDKFIIPLILLIIAYAITLYFNHRKKGEKDL